LKAIILQGIHKCSDAVLRVSRSDDSLGVGVCQSVNDRSKTVL